ADAKGKKKEETKAAPKADAKVDEAQPRKEETWGTQLFRQNVRWKPRFDLQN
ncbi:unnamed protein product, partial [Durusdinium trenchii]